MTREANIATAGGSPARGAAQESRPGLALAAALLAIPGTTMAWDLPAGGLWIGLPLCIVAIVLGLRARRARNRPTMATVAIAIASLCVLMMAVWTIAEVVS